MLAGRGVFLEKEEGFQLGLYGEQDGTGIVERERRETPQS